MIDISDGGGDKNKGGQWRQPVNTKEINNLVISGSQQLLAVRGRPGD